MTVESIKPGVTVSGPFIPEPIEVLAVVPLGPGEEREVERIPEQLKRFL